MEGEDERDNMSCPECGADIHRPGFGNDSVRNLAPIRLTDGGAASCDPCPWFVRFVQALNDGGMRTAASCCGHGKCPPHVMLADGRWVVVLRQEDVSAALALWDGPARARAMTPRCEEL